MPPIHEMQCLTYYSSPSVHLHPTRPFQKTDFLFSLFVRLAVGPLCDRFGPRVIFAGCLLIGAIPTALAGTISSAAGLYVIRFFIGILGASFVPCQVWSTGFFDKNVVGTSNALTAGWGNAGGGITVRIFPVELIGRR